jgi:WD40 repeat protein
MRLWDFSGMNVNMHSFRNVEPIDGQPLRNLSFSKDSKLILGVVQGTQVIMLDREGRKGKRSVKGDMYLMDMSKTNGHVSEVTDGLFSPAESNWFATCSHDATVRLWDLNKRLHGVEQQMTQTYLVKCCDERGQKTYVNTLQYSTDG